MLFSGIVYGQEAATKSVVSDIIGAFESKASGGYAAYQNTDAGIVSYGKYQFTALYGTKGSLYAVLKKYTELSQSDKSKQIYANYVQNTDPWKDLELLRTDEKLKTLLKEAASEDADAMKEAQDDVFTTMYYEPTKTRAANDGVTSALGIAIVCDTRINGHYETAIEQTEAYFTGKQNTEQEWLEYFLNRRQDLLKKGSPNSPNLDRVSVLRKLVDDNNLDLKQGDSNHKIDLGKYGKVDTIDAPPSTPISNPDTGSFGTSTVPAINSADQTDASQLTSAKFIVGAKVETTDSLNVRNAPGTSSGTVTSTKTAGSTGTTIAGPVYADGFTWWQIQYDDGTTGWSEDKRLESVRANQKTTAAVDALSFGISQGLEPITSSVTQSADQGNAKSDLGSASVSLSSPNSKQSPAFGLSSDEKDLSKTGQVSKENTASESLGEKAAENAKQLEGVSYGYGGKGFDLNSQKLSSAQDIKNGYNWYNANDKAIEKSSAIDCSGLVYWAFNAAAGEDASEAPLSIHDANTMWTQDVNQNADHTIEDGYIRSTPPKSSDLKPGDLLFLDTPDKKPGTIDHVAMYVGNNEVVQSKEGVGVEKVTYDQWLNEKIDKTTTYSTYFAGYGTVKATDKAEKSDLGGINFTSIKLNSIAISTDQEGGINLDLILKAQKAEGAGPGIDLINSTQIGATAFMTGLANPDCKFWVSLNPWEEDRIIDEQLGQTDVGRIMLEADLQMKRDIHYYDNPCATETGVAFWNLLDEKRDALVEQCMKKFPGEIEDIDNVQFFPVERHWIVPDKIYAYTNGTQIYVINATLTINSTSEEDRSSFQVYNQNKEALSEGCREELNKSAIEFSQYVNMLQDRMILPYVMADVNHDEKYEDLRNVYVALALSQWYKSTVTSYMDVFREFRDVSDPSSYSLLKSQRPLSPKEIWYKYVYSFKNGEYKCWKNETTKTATGTHTESSPRSAGGVDFYDIKNHLVEIKRLPPEVQGQVKRAVIDGVIDEGKDLLFGNRLHMNRKQDSPISGSGSGSSPQPEGPNDKRTDKLTSLHNETVLGQSGGISPVAKDGGNASSVTCPDGWMGPNEKGECFRLQIGGKS